MNVRALPICRKPVGDGANRARSGMKFKNTENRVSRATFREFAIKRRELGDGKLFGAPRGCGQSVKPGEIEDTRKVVADFFALVLETTAGEFQEGGAVGPGRRRAGRQTYHRGIHLGPRAK